MSVELNMLMQTETTPGVADVGQLRSWNVLKKHFDGISYVERYIDIAREVSLGLFSDGFDHFILHGLRERRQIFLYGNWADEIALAPFLLYLGMHEEVEEIYKNFLARRFGKFDLDRYAEYDGKWWDPRGPVYFARDYENITQHEISHPHLEDEWTYEMLEPLVILHEQIEDGWVTSESVRQFQSIVKISREETIGRGLQVIFATATHDKERRADLSTLIRSFFIRNCCRFIPTAMNFRGPYVEGAVLSEFEIVTALGTNNYQVASDHFCELSLNGKSKGYEFCIVLAIIANLEVIEETFFSDRGKKCGSNFKLISKLQAMLPRHCFNTSFLLNGALARVEQHRGEFESAIHFYKNALKIAPDFFHANGLMVECLMHLGLVSQAEQSYSDLGEATNLSIGVADTLSYIRKWAGKQDSIVRWVDKLSEQTSLPADFNFQSNPKNIPLRWQDMVLRGVALADHDFRLQLHFDGLAAVKDEAIFFGRMPKAFELSVYSDVLTLKIGDGLRWVYELPLIGLRRRDSVSIVVTRLGQNLTVDLNGVRQFSHQIREDFWIRGESFEVSRTFVEAKTYSVSVAADIEIEKYPDPKPAECLTFLSVFWGKSYAEMFADIAVPSLIKSGTLEDVAKLMPTNYCIYCPPAEAKIIEKAIRNIRRFIPDVHIFTHAFSDDHSDNVNLLHDLLPLIWRKIEADNGLVVMAQPDHCFGTGLANIVEKFEGNDYWVAGHPRVSFESGASQIKNLLKKKGKLDNADLVTFAANSHPHVTFRTGLRKNNEKWLNATRRKDHFEVYFKEPPPLVLRPTKDMQSVFSGSPFGNPFEQIDHDIVDLVYRQGRLKVVDNSDDFFWFEFSSDDKNLPTIRNLYWSLAAQYLSKTPLKWNLPIASSEKVGKPKPVRKRAAGKSRKSIQE